MTLQEASFFFENLKTETSKKAEINVYENFIYILNNLNKRNLSKDETQSIETKLGSFNLNSAPKNKLKFFKKTLREFENYLKETFSLISKGYYTKLYGGLGLSFGILFGVVFLSNLERSLGISLGLIGGMIIGSIIGRNMDSQAKSSGKML